MKKYTLIVSLLLLIACQYDNKKETVKENEPFPFFVGTYTANESEGIYKYQLNKDGSLDSVSLLAKSENPSFLTFSKDKKFLLAVNEIDDEQGGIESYRISNDSLKLINRSKTGGAHPCFVSINKVGYIVAANYSGGNIGLLKLDNNGELSKLIDIQQHDLENIENKDKVPHAHASRFESASNNIISVDLGTNELIFSKIDTILNKFSASGSYKLKMEKGAGPRHFEFHPNGKWIYVVNELNSTVTLVQKSPGNTYEKASSLSTLPENYTDSNYCADIHISKDGQFLYASNRGHNSIAIFKVNEADGTLTLTGHSKTHGEWPRNFSLSPNDEYLLVANQHTNNIVSFKRDKTTGLLSFIDEINAPVPVCILFMN